MCRRMTAIISSICGIMFGTVVGMVGMGKVTRRSIEEKSAASDKHLELFLLMNQWVKVKQQGRNVSSYFIKHGYHKIAIYGMSYAGEALLNELKDSSIEVIYGIDKNADKIYAEGIDIVTAEDSLEKVDVIVVTAITFFDEIEEQLSGKINCPIISLKEILYDI